MHVCAVFTTESYNYTTILPLVFSQADLTHPRHPRDLVLQNLNLHLLGFLALLMR